MRILTYNYLINKYIFNNQICKYNNYLPNKPKKFTFNNTEDVKNFIRYYHFKNHDFGDLNLTDEIVINDGTYNKIWLIAGFNTQLDTDVKNGTFGKHHLTLIPKGYLFDNVRMHNEDNNSKGFAGTEMFNITMPEVNNNLSNVLDEYLLPHKMMLSIDNKVEMKSFTVKSMLLNYYQAFGVELPYKYFDSYRYSYSTEKYINNNFNNKDDCYQLPLFTNDIRYMITNKTWLLRNEFGNYYFANVYYRGYASYYYAGRKEINTVLRPFLCIG